MTIEEKLIKMFVMIHGEPGTSCYAEVMLDDDYEPCGVALMKDGNVCWAVSKTDLILEYVTREWSE